MTRSPGGEKQQWIFFADRIGLFDFAEKIRSVSELGFKIYAYFLSDLIAATLDSWADGGLDVPRIGTKATAHFTHPFLDDSPDRTAPPGVKNTHGTVFGIDEHDRKAVGSLNAEQDSGSVGDQAVAGELFLEWFENTMNEIRMNLAQSDPWPEFLARDSADLTFKRRAVSLYCGT